MLLITFIKQMPCRYFSLQASEPLGMADDVRLEVENRICDEQGPRVDSYSVPQQIAYDIMNQVECPHIHVVLYY